MKKLKPSLLALIIHLSVSVFSQGTSEGYRNPVVRGYAPDPSICRVGENYYMVTGSNMHFPDIPIWQSKDLVHWKRIGFCMTRKEQFFLDKNGNHPRIYAPTIRYHQGTLYVIATDLDGFGAKGGGNFYLTAQDPTGPWSDPIVIDAPMFDPSLFCDEDGKVYYTRRGAIEDKDIVQAEIDIKTGKLLTPLRSISLGLYGDDSEAPHLFKRGKYYYLTMGEGGSRYLHMQNIARSESPWGPWEKCPHNPIIHQHIGWWHHQMALGHADFIEDHKGNSWAVCLGQRKADYMDFCVIGRETFLFPVDWKEGWPYVDPEMLINAEITTSTLPLKPWPEEAARDNFDQEELGLQWGLSAYPLKKVYSLSDRPGFLRLYGQPEVLGDGEVAYIGTRQKEMEGEILVKMEFEPTSENEEAGLACYQTSSTLYTVFVTIRDGQKVVRIRKTVGDMVLEAGWVPVSGQEVLLKVTFNTKDFSFYVSEDQDKWTKIASGQSNLISNDVGMSLGGISIGPYASGNGSLCSTPADFDWFESHFNEVKFGAFGE